MDSTDNVRQCSPDEFRKEIRFAVVMYGGVSLAIYMNGISTELLNLVRSTSNNGDTAQKSTARFYRRLAQILSKEDDDESKVSPDDPIRTRFMIDVISGTSAGGINGIYLAKALANDQPFDGLHDLWIQEADISKLINDEKSRKGMESLPREDGPESLLNSQRMFVKLYEALDQMDGKIPENKSPYVDRLNLYVTTTDINGQALPLRLYDEVVEERRYRFDYHFRYVGDDSGEPYHNDFMPENTPFLAFAARCTSSFPFAFEPMQFSEIAPLVQSVKPVFQIGEELRKQWMRFFTQGGPLGNRLQSPESRYFGDGGYLNNKPFSFITEALQGRSSPLPVDRFLFYIEPSPDNPVNAPSGGAAPNAIQNSLRALLTIPLDQTIREDLQRVLERNREILRVTRIIELLEASTLSGTQEINPKRKTREAMWQAASDQQAGVVNRGIDLETTAKKWAATKLVLDTQKQSFSYSGYERLKVAATTDDLASFFSTLAGFDEKSDEFYAVRCITRAWRDFVYNEHNEKPTLHQFLLDFDMGFRLRRFQFLLRRADHILKLDDPARKSLAAILGPEGFAFDPEQPWPRQEKVAFQKASLLLRAKLQPLYQAVQVQLANLRTPPNLDRSTPSSGPSPLYAAVLKLGIDKAKLLHILGKTDSPEAKAEFAFNEEKSVERAGELIRNQAGKLKNGFDSLRTALTDQLGNIWKTSSKDLLSVLGADLSGLTAPEAAAYRLLRYYYDKFDDYDSVIFPITYGTDFGEASPVNVVRISPEDATAIVNERTLGCKKLAGVKLAHFGAFLETAWRRNDIIWGRLDGAERIIEALLPAKHARHGEAADLITKAQELIIQEELIGNGQQEVGKTLVQAMLNRDKETRRGMGAFTEKPAGSDVRTQLLDILMASMKPPQLLAALKDCPDHGEPDRADALLDLSRATRVTSKILKKISQGSNIAGAWSRWFARMALAFSGFVEIAIPGSFCEAIGRHLMALAVLIELVLIGGGFLLGKSEAEHMGIELLAATALVILVVQVLTDYLTYTLGSWKKYVAALALLLFAILVFLASLEPRHLLHDFRDIGKLFRH